MMFLRRLKNIFLLLFFICASAHGSEYNENQIKALKKSYAYLKTINLYLDQCKHLMPERKTTIDTLSVDLDKKLVKIIEASINDNMPIDIRRKFTDGEFNRYIISKIDPHAEKLSDCRILIANLSAMGIENGNSFFDEIRDILGSD